MKTTETFKSLLEGFIEEAQKLGVNTLKINATPETHEYDYTATLVEEKVITAIGLNEDGNEFIYSRYIEDECNPYTESNRLIEELSKLDI